MHLRITAGLLVAVLSGCSATPAGQVPSPTGPDAMTTAALRSIAQQFNDEFGTGDYGPVYDRWDSRSRALITRGEYVRRHLECATGPQDPAHVESAEPGSGGYWLVRYEIDDQQFTDYWRYAGGRWVFDLVLSNPDAVRLYTMSAAAYAVAVRCNGT